MDSESDCIILCGCVVPVTLHMVMWSREKFWKLVQNYLLSRLLNINELFCLHQLQALRNSRGPPLKQKKILRALEQCDALLEPLFLWAQRVNTKTHTFRDRKYVTRMSRGGERGKGGEEREGERKRVQMSELGNALKNYSLVSLSLYQHLFL